MEAFVKFERRLQEQYRFHPYFTSGRALLSSLGTAIKGDLPTTSSSVILVAIDFERVPGVKCGLNEFGIATINAGSLFPGSDSPEIPTENFALKNHRNRKFRFGTATRIHEGILVRTIMDIFEDISRTKEMCQIVLVGHGIGNELRILDKIDLPVEGLPIAGILDTHVVAEDIIGYGGHLEDLLADLGIPCPRYSLHCAGNDAHYTLRVLLALIGKRCGDPCGHLNELVRRPVPQPPRWTKQERGDWEAYLNSDTFGLFDEGEEVKPLS